MKDMLRPEARRWYERAVARGMVQKAGCYHDTWQNGEDRYSQMCYSDLPYLYTGRGFVELHIDQTRDLERLGAHVVGNRACDMISELVDTIALEGGYQELARISHPHPTISEAVLDAARAVDGWATHA